MILQPETIERQVKCSAKPYPDIIANAVKKGWKIIVNEQLLDTPAGRCQRVAIEHPNHWIYETAYSLDEPTCALYNVYGWPK